VKSAPNNGRRLLAGAPAAAGDGAPPKARPFMKPLIGG
jgi:hypothetical protein